MKALITTIVYLSCTIFLFAQDTIYVPNEQSTIQAAIDEANNGDIVLVDEGLYYENINFKGKAITVASNFIIDGNESHIQNTIIDGSQASDSLSGSVVKFYMGEDTTSVLCGFTITGGTGWFNHGGGIYISHSGAVVKNNIIENNHLVSNLASVVRGSAIYINLVYNKTLIIENNIIRNNFAQATATSSSAVGTIFIQQSSGIVRISNNIISDNIISSVQENLYCNGGAISAFGINDTSYSCIIENNKILRNIVISLGQNPLGGGLFLETTSVIVRNNIIAYNSAKTGAGVFYWTPVINPIISPILENNTLYGNIAQINGGAIHTYYNYEVKNCLIWGNSNPQYSPIHITQISYTCTEEPYAGVGNITLDPQIQDTINYLINSSSPCIDAGNPDAQYSDKVHPYNLGCSFPPACGTLRNDMGHFGGPSSHWCNWEWPYSIDLPSVPILVSPTGNPDTTQVEFIWIQSNPFVLRYWFEIDTTSSFTSAFIDSLVTDTTYLFSNLEYGKEYWWRVRAENAGGWGEFSSVGSLFVVSVESDDKLPTKFSLEQNYPNPFNPSTKIQYSVPQSSQVVIKVFDVLGNEIETLINEEKSIGSYEITWNAENLPSGVYFYQIKSGEYTAVKKVSLIK